MKNEEPEGFSGILKSEWHPTKNSNDSLNNYHAKSSTKVWWLCHKHQYSYLTRINHRVAGSGCPICAGNKIVPGINDLGTLYPDVATQYSVTNEQPVSTLSPKSNVRVTWTHPECYHSWIQSPKSRTRKSASSQTSCAVCTNTVLQSGVNDLKTLYPLISSQWHPTKNLPLMPENINKGSGKRVWWLCPKGHEWEAVIRDRTGKDKTGCLVCSNRVIKKGVNDFATQFPQIVEQWHPTKNLPLTPDKISSGCKERIVWVCSKGHEWETYIYNRTGPYLKGCPSCAKHVSKAENQIAEYLETLTTIRRNDRSVIAPQELDIYIPDRKIAIEYNGLYWHTETAGKDKTYHYNKWKACHDAGIHLIQIWEDTWLNSPLLVQQMLAHKLGVSNKPHLNARSLTIDNATKEDTYSLLEDNHVQGYVSSSYRFGLYSASNELVAVLCLEEESNDSSDYILTRYGAKQPVRGGFAKLLKHAIKALSITKITTFSDNAVSDGALYSSHGFLNDGVLRPDYCYVYRNVREHKFNFRLKRFKDDPSLEYREGLSERELAELNNLPRIWDAGKVRWVLDVG